MLVFKIMLFLLIINSLELKSTNDDNFQAYFFLSSTSCPECRMPKINELNNALKKLLPNIITNLVFDNQSEINCSEIQKRFNNFDFFFCGEEAGILSKFYSSQNNEAKLVIVFADSIKKVIHLYDLYNLNQHKLSSIITKHFNSSDMSLNNIDLNDAIISSIILTDKSNRDSTILIDIDNNNIYLFDNTRNVINQKIVIPDSIVSSLLGEVIDPIIKNAIGNTFKYYYIINIFELDRKEIVILSNILTEVTIDTTYEYYDEKQEQVLTLLPMYTYKLIKYDIPSKTFYFDSIPYNIVINENLYQLFKNENKYYLSNYISHDTIINHLSIKLPFMSYYIPENNVIKNIDLKDIVHLIQDNKIKRSLSNLIFNHLDSSFTLFNLKNNLFFIVKSNGEIVNITPSGALNYITSSRVLKNQIYLLTNSKYDQNDLINITADNKYIYVALRYIDNDLNNFKIILQKYKLNGQIFSEEVLDLNDDSIQNFQFIKVRDGFINALIYSSKKGWQLLRINT